MKWDNNFYSATKRDFMNKRRDCGREHPDWVMDEKEAYFRQQLEEFVKKRPRDKWECEHKYFAAEDE